MAFNATEEDKRLLSVTIQIRDQKLTYSTPGLYISATGTKYGNSLQNECDVSIYNLKKDVRDYLLTETSPFNRNRSAKAISVSAGRESYGESLVYSGEVVAGTIAQPPDIGLTLKCLSLNYQKGTIISVAQPEATLLSTICQLIASGLNLSLQFQATDQRIANFNYAGPSAKQINYLNTLRGITAYVDNQILVVKNSGQPIKGLGAVNVNIDTGMVGIPEPTEFGVKVKFMFSPLITLGGEIALTSIINPSLNGNYLIYKLNFDLQNRDDSFYWIIEAQRIQNWI